MDGGRISFGPFLLDKDNALLWREGQRVLVAPKPLAILSCLVGRPGSLLTKDELLDAVWPGVHVSEFSLTVAMNALRAVLGDDRAAPSYIETAPKRGYRFIAPVSLQPSNRAPSLAPPRAPQSADPRREAWVGRAEALATIEAALGRARGGRRETVFLLGEAGIGKTTLIEMALSTVIPGDVGVLRCASNELYGAHEAFLPLVSGLSELCRSADGAAAIAALRTCAPTWTAQMPWILADEERSENQREVFGANRERMLREFVDLMEALAAERPWVVVIEDLHWSDPATVDAFSRLARGEGRAELALIASFRPADAVARRHPAASVHRDLQAHDRCVDIVLEPLTPKEVERHLSLRFSSGEIAGNLVQGLFARTRGQPLFVVSVVDHLVSQRAVQKINGQWRLEADRLTAAEALPNDLREMIRANLSRLDAEDRALVDGASAAGPAFSALLLAGALARDVLDVEDSCEKLVDAAKMWVRAGVAEWPDGAVSGEYSFVHAIYQEVAYQQLSPARKAHIHRRLGEALEAGFGARASEQAPALALHFEIGRDFVKAQRYLGLAAASSASRFSPREAVAYLTRALAITSSLPPEAEARARPALLLQRAWGWRASGDFAAAVQDLAAMVESARKGGDIAAEVSGLVNLSRFHLYVDRRRCLPLAEAADASARGIETVAIRALAEGNLANLRLMLLPWRDEYAHACRRAIAAIDDSQDFSARMRRHSLEMTVAMVQGDYATCCEAAQRGRKLAQTVGDLFFYALYALSEALALIYRGQWGEARDLAEDTLAIAEKNLNPHASALCRLTLAILFVEAQDFTGAVEAIQGSLSPVVEANPLEYFIGHSVLATAQLGLGDLTQARAEVAAMEARSAASHGVVVESTMLPIYLLSRCNVFIASGDLAAARQEAEILHAQVNAAADRQNLALAEEAVARISLAENQPEAAARRLATAVRLVRRGGAPLAAWRSYETAARLCERRGRAVAAAAFRRRRDRVIAALAASTPPDDVLRETPLLTRANG